MDQHQAASTPNPPVQAFNSLDSWLRFSPLYIVLAVLAVYWRVLGFDFTGLDDVSIIRLRYFIIGDLSNIKLAFTTDAFLGTGHSFYRPLQTVSFMLDAFFGGPGPFVYHLSNLFLHIGVSLAVWWLLLTLGYKHLPSLLLALLFALHPLFVPVVAWVPTRGDLLLTLFAIIGFVLFIKSLRANDPRLVLYHGVVFFLAFLAKETAVAIPPVCLAYYYFEHRRSPARKLIPHYLIVWALAGAAWYYLRSLIHTPQLPGEALGLAAFQKNLRVLPELVGKLFVPFHFQLLPLFTLTDTVVGTAAAAVLVWAVFRSGGRRNHRLRLGLLWFLLFLLPVMVFRNTIAQYIFDYLYHRSYVSSVGLIIILAELLARVNLPDNKYLQRVGFAALLILAYCGIAASREVAYYRDQKTFFTEAAARTPGTSLAYNNRGVYYFNDLRDYKAALKDYTKAIEIFPGYVQALVNRGVTYAAIGKNKEAMADLEAALKLNPNDPDTLIQSGNLRYDLNDYAGALGDFNKLLGMDRLYPRVYSKKAGSEAMLGQAEQALRDADEALRLDPKDEEAFNSRGLANRLLGKPNEAIGDFSAAINLQKSYSRPYNNRGAVYLARGERHEALEDFRKAIALDEHYGDAYSNLACVEHELGQDEQALKDVETALRLNPNLAGAYQNRGLIRTALKKFSEALADYSRAIELDPKSASAYLNRGVLYTDHLDKYDAGIADFRRVLELDPAGSNAAINIGVALYKKRDFQQAIDQWSSLLKTMPSNGELYYLRARAYAELHDYANAFKDGTQAKNLGTAVDERALASWQTQQTGK